MKTPLIRTENLGFSYAGRQAPVLSNVNFSLDAGEWVAIVGANGSGKSTFARELNALLLPVEGTVWVDEIDTRDESLILEVRRRVGMVFQNPDNQLVATLVEEDVAFASENLGVPTDELRSRVQEALDDVGMEEYSHYAVHQLSGGQKQRVAIAGILAMRPRCIVLDEATAMLDPQGRQEVLRTVRELQTRYQTAVIWITHFMEEVVAADRVLVFADGKVLTEGSVQEVFRQTSLLSRAGLELPPAIALSQWLISQGYLSEQPIFTLEECALALQKRLEEKTCR